MSDDRLRDELRRAFGRGYRPPEPGLADRALQGAFERLDGAGDRRPAKGRWLPAAAAVALAALTVVVLVTLSAASHARPTPAASPSAAPPPSPVATPSEPPAVVISATVGSPLQRIDWNGQPAGTFTTPASPPASGLLVAPDGRLAAVFGNGDAVSIVDGSTGRVLGTSQWSRDTRTVRWADDSSHWCALQGGGLLYADVQPGGTVGRRLALAGPGLPSSSALLVACSATAGRAVVVVPGTSCTGKGCAAFVDTVDLRTGTVTASMQNPAGPSFGNAVASDNGRFFAESDLRGDTSIMWDLTTGAVVDRPAGMVESLSSDGRMVATTTRMASTHPVAHLVDRVAGHDVWSRPDTLMNDARFEPGGDACVVTAGQDALLIRVDGSTTVLAHGTGTAYPQIYTQQ